MKKNVVYSLCLCGMMSLVCSCNEGVSSDGLQTFKIDTEAEAVELTLDDYADYTLIPLETRDSVLIGHVYGVQIYNDVMAVCAEEVIFFYDLQGNYLSTLSHKGDGPEDYNFIRDFKFTKEGNLVISSDYDALKVYDRQNQFLRSYRFTGYDFTLLDNDIYSYTASNASKGRISVYSMETGDSICSFSAVDPYPGMDIAVPFKAYAENESYYIPAFSDTIYTVKDRAQTPKYVLDFGEASVKPEILQAGSDFVTFFTTLMEGHEVVSVEMFLKGKQYTWMQTLQFDGTFEDSSLDILPISKMFCIQPDGQALRFEKLKLKKYQNFSIEPHRILTVDANQLAISVSADELLDHAESLSPEERKAFMKQLKLSNDDQNPYVLLLKSR